MNLGSLQFYNGFRHFNSASGRYISPDPRGTILDYSQPQRQIAKQLGIRVNPDLHVVETSHLYGYALQNPMIYNDPSGEFLPIIAPVVVKACIASGITGTAIAAAYGYYVWDKIFVDMKKCAEECGSNSEIQEALDRGETGKLHSCKSECGLDHAPIVP
ncbi:MAG: hypothetical protein K0U66_01760 [Gammaproteobacteria bacterium]|nr:hypothetical protein [Gammaproteobacteria bacterium]